MLLQRHRVTKPDGRTLWYYSSDTPMLQVLPNISAPAMESAGLELRWHPLLEEWIVVAPER